MSNSRKITVIGSTNTDMVIKSPTLPRPGETILGGTFFMMQGGKGANQAVAVARLGGDLRFVAKTGNDIFGHKTRELLKLDGIEEKYLLIDPQHPSGVALITIDEQAENSIVVSSGANGYLLPADLEQIPEVITEADLILMQLEIPMETIEYVVQTAYTQNKKVILNPAPGCKLSPQLLEKLFLITPNETEAEIISGVKITDFQSAEQAARKIHEWGVAAVVITLGSKGALICSDSIVERIPAVQVNAVDTTAAGDVFNGALAVALSEGESLFAAVQFATRAAALSVTRLGAQSSVPFRREL